MRSILLIAALFWSCVSWAATDKDALARELNIMREILRTASDSTKTRSARVSAVTAHYLEGQGVLFRASLRDHHLRVARYGDIDLSKVPDFVSDIMADVRLSIPYFASEELEALRELREEQRDLREEQRDIKRKLRESSRKYGTAVARDRETEDIEEKIAELEADLEALDKQYDELAAEIEFEHERFREEREGRYEQRRIDRRQTYAALETLLLQTLCDYGGTLKSLPSNEHVNLLIENVRRENGDEFDRVYVFEKKDVLACQEQSIDLAKLRERGTVYEQ
ncbi:MAG: hypothetical protein V3T15_00375 [Pseudomonadales bacterium]